MPARRLEYMPLDELVPADRNPKDHAPAALEASMSRFGYLEPLIIDERTGKLIAGHGRRDELLRRHAAREPAPEGIRIRADRWEVPVTRGWASRDDTDAEAAAVAVNRIVELGGWDEEALAPILAGWAAAGEDLTALGYDQAALDDLEALLQERGAGDEPPDPYRNLGVRSIILDYPLKDFETVTKQCQALRASRAVASNTELIRDLVLGAAHAD